MMYTMADVARVADADLDHFEAELAVPVLSGMQAQGDLYMIPADGRRLVCGSRTHASRTVRVFLPSGQTWDEYWPTDPDVPGESEFFDLTFESTDPARTPLPAAGVTLVTGRQGHSHCLIGDGPVFFDRADGQTLGTVTVPDVSVAFVFHATETLPRRLAEHEPLGAAPGTYVIRRQREQADEIRLTED